MEVTKLRCFLRDYEKISRILESVQFSYLPTIRSICYFTVNRHDAQQIQDMLKECDIFVAVEGHYHRNCIDTPLST